MSRGRFAETLGHHSGIHRPSRLLRPRIKAWQSRHGRSPIILTSSLPFFLTQLLHGNVHEGENLAKAMRRIKAGAKDKEGGDQALLDKLTDAADKLLTMGYHNVFTDDKTQVCACVKCAACAFILLVWVQGLGVDSTPFRVQPAHSSTCGARVRARVPGTCVHSRACVFGVADVVVAVQIGGRLQAAQQQAQTKEQGASQAEAFAAMMAFDDGRQWEYQFPQVGPISTPLPRGSFFRR